MSPTPTQHPLTDQHCQCLDRVLAATSNAIQLAKDCQDCGLDMTEFTAQLTAQRDMAAKLKAKFFPHKS